ncbi:MAG: hypothetical protein LBF16_00275, partial [Pseudomonadales bacterium]|nr:hypothetical protein [Pseudomonadales bacterium]
MALVLVFFLVLGIANQPLGMLLGLGIFFIIIGIWRRKHPLVIFRQDYFETKIAPAAGHHKVLYSEVVKAEITPKQLLNLYYQPHNASADAAPKRIKINLKVLKEPERE